MATNTAASLIEASQPHVRAIAADVAGSRRDRVEEFFQIGMLIVCERAPQHAGETVDRFMQLVYHRVMGQMLDVTRAESAARGLETAIERAVERVTVNLDEGDYFDPEERRTAHRRRAAAAVVAASLIAILAPQQDTTPELMLERAEEEERVRQALLAASATVAPDDWALVQEVWVEGVTFQAAGAKRDLTPSGAWRRVEATLAKMHQKMSEQLA